MYLILFIVHQKACKDTTKNAHTQESEHYFQKKIEVCACPGCVRTQGNAQKRATLACHSECLHNRIILIVYIHSFVE